MSRFELLPTEILLEIVCFLSPDLRDLRNVSLVCRSLNVHSTAALYKHVDLSHTGKPVEDPLGRQIILLQSIAENPRLGAHVQSFANHDFPDYLEDATACDEVGEESLINVAMNMKHLCKASLTPGPMAEYITSNLQSYKQLRDLSVHRLRPEDCIWSGSFTSLTSLTWELHTGWHNTNGYLTHWRSVRFIIDVVEATCPSLQSLDIVESSRLQPWPSAPRVANDNARLFLEGDLYPQNSLLYLRHFGLHCARYGDDETGNDVELVYFAVIQRYQHSLKSIVLSALKITDIRTQATPQFVNKVCEKLPGLRELTIKRSHQHTEPWTEITSLNFHTALTITISTTNPLLERLSIADSGCYFTPGLGKLFSSLKSLKYLKIRDGGHLDGPYHESDGTLGFEAYENNLFEFIKALPQSLEELIVVINGGDLTSDEDDGFDCICHHWDIFVALPRLYSCDILAWLADIDRDIGEVPKKAVFYRRLPSYRVLKNLSSTDSSDYHKRKKQKIICISRMDCIYQGGIEVVKDLYMLKDDFMAEGRDADEEWCEGFTTHIWDDVNMRNHSDHAPDLPWPFRKDRIEAYSPFRDTYHH